MGKLLHLVQRGGDWAGPQPAQAPPQGGRSSYIRRQVDEAAANSPRLLWQTIGRLLHPSSNYDNWFDGMDTTALTDRFSAFFMDKVRRVKSAVDSELKSVYVASPQITHTALSSFLSTFTLITAAEVARLIQAAPTKTLPLDTLPISLLKQNHLVWLHIWQTGLSLSAAFLLRWRLDWLHGTPLSRGVGYTSTQRCT